MTEGEVTQVSTELASQHQEAKPDISLGDINISPSIFNYSLILKGCVKVPTFVPCLYIEHEDHMLVLIILSGTNVDRKCDLILQDYEGPISD